MGIQQWFSNNPYYNNHKKIENESKDDANVQFW